MMEAQFEHASNLDVKLYQLSRENHRKPRCFEASLFPSKPLT